MYDPKCLELAEYFLAPEVISDKTKMELAQYIQNAVEDYITCKVKQIHDELTQDLITKTIN